MGVSVCLYVCPHANLAALQLIRKQTIRYDTRCYFNVRSKADISQLNLPHVVCYSATWRTRLNEHNSVRQVDYRG